MMYREDIDSILSKGLSSVSFPHNVDQRWRYSDSVQLLKDYEERQLFMKKLFILKLKDEQFIQCLI